MTLTQAQKTHFEEQGYLPYHRILSDGELQALRQRSEQIAQGQADHVPPRYVQLEAAFREGDGTEVGSP